MCSLIANQPAPKKDKRGEFMYSGGAGQAPIDPYVSSNISYALESIIETRPYTLFFQYLSYCGKVRDIFRVRKCAKTVHVYYKLADNAIEYNCVTNVMAKAGVVMTDDDDWNLILVSPHIGKEDLKKVPKNKKCNHFPG